MLWLYMGGKAFLNLILQTHKKEVLNDEMYKLITFTKTEFMQGIFAHPPPRFPLALTWPGIVHHLFGS